MLPCAICELAKQSIFSLVILNVFTRHFLSGGVFVYDMCGNWFIFAVLTLFFSFLSCAHVEFASPVNQDLR